MEGYESWSDISFPGPNKISPGLGNSLSSAYESGLRKFDTSPVPYLNLESIDISAKVRDSTTRREGQVSSHGEINLELL